MRDRKLVVETSGELLRKLKMYAAEHGVTMKAVVDGALQQFLGLKEGGEKK